MPVKIHINTTDEGPVEIARADAVPPGAGGHVIVEGDTSTTLPERTNLAFFGATVEDDVSGNTTEVTGLKGADGLDGLDGLDGEKGATILGHDTYGNIILKGGTFNDIWIVSADAPPFAAEGDGMTYTAQDTWQNIGRLEGPPGDIGPEGPQGIPGEDGSGIQYMGMDTWLNIAAIPSPAQGDAWILTDLTGGPPLRADATPAEIGDWMVWNLSQWDNTGPREGDTGPIGPEGPAGTTDHTALTNLFLADQHSIPVVSGLQAALDAKEPTISPKETGFNRPYGSSANTVTEGNDSRLSDARPPTTHTHPITQVTNLQTSLDAKADQTALDAHTTDTTPHVSTQDRLDWDGATTHAALTTGNPHAVTAAEAGADPTGSAATVQGNLDTHTADQTNPHLVTAAQAGADPTGTADAAVSTHEASYNHLLIATALQHIAEDLTPVTGGNLLFDGHSAIFSDNLGNVVAAAAYSNTLANHFVLYHTTDGAYTDGAGGLLLGPAFFEVHGQQFTFKSPAISMGALPLPADGGTLRADSVGNVYVQEDPTPPAEEEDLSLSAQTVNLAPALITDLSIDPLLNTYSVGQARFHIRLGYKNSSTRTGFLHVAAVVDDVQGAETSTIVGTQAAGTLSVDIPISTEVAAGSKLELACWRTDDAQAMTLALEPPDGGHYMWIYQTSGSGAEDVKDLKISGADTASGFLGTKLLNNDGSALSVVDDGGGALSMRLPAVGAPGTHAATHRTAGGDAVQLEQAQIDGLVVALAGKEPTISPKETGFNLPLGTLANTSAEGDHLHIGVYEPDGTSATNIATHEAGTGVHTIAATTGLQTALDAKGQVNAVGAGTDIAVDATDPANPVVSFTGEGAGSFELSVYNASGGTLLQGAPVYISGFNVGQSVVEIDLADANVIASMPAIGLTKADIGNNSLGTVTSIGSVLALDTSAWTAGDSLFVSPAVGTLTNARPTDATSLVQKVGVVTRSHVSLGSIHIVGAGRINDIPNIMPTSITRIADGTDPSKIAIFDVSAVTPGQERTIAMPDAPVNLGDIGQVDSVGGGTDITVDAADPANPIVNYTGPSGGTLTYTDLGTVADASTTAAPATSPGAHYAIKGPGTGAFIVNVTHSFTGSAAGIAFIDIDNADAAALTLQVNGTTVPATTWTDTPSWAGHIRMELYVSNGSINNATWGAVEGA